MQQAAYNGVTTLTPQVSRVPRALLGPHVGGTFQLTPTSTSCLTSWVAPLIPALPFHTQVRKVSNKLFSDPRSSVRRSQRLAALNTAAAAAMSGGHGGGGGGGPSGGGGGGGLFTPYGPATSVQGQAKSGQASYVEVGTRELRGNRTRR